MKKKSILTVPVCKKRNEKHVEDQSLQLETILEKANGSVAVTYSMYSNEAELFSGKIKNRLPGTQIIPQQTSFFLSEGALASDIPSRITALHARFDTVVVLADPGFCKNFPGNYAELMGCEEIPTIDVLPQNGVLYTDCENNETLLCSAVFSKA